jgi:nitronate monooxygenase
MKSPICDMLGIEFPLLAFSHCRDVVAAVSRAGGFGVLGATSHSPESIELELKWIDDHVDGKPYGLDVLIPENISTAGVGLIDSVKSAGAVVQEFKEDFVEAVEHMNALVSE